MSNQPLFTRYRMGGLDLPNRIVMAPLTRRLQPVINAVGAINRTMPAMPPDHSPLRD
jgi:2,4-dienoyl-CoA reductase-like NADH-dependent reductase (Old Yellow Enzyme family)